MESIFTSIVSLLSSTMSFLSAIPAMIQQRLLFNSGKAAGENESLQKQDEAEKEVTQMVQEQAAQPHVSTNTTVDAQALVDRIKDGKF